MAALDNLLSEARGRSFATVTVQVTALPAAGIIAAETLVALHRIQTGLLLYVLLLGYLTLLPLRLPDATPYLQAFVLLPVFRLINLGMPAFVELTLYWLPLIYAPMLIAVVIVLRSNPLLISSLGWKLGLLTLPVTILLGAAIGHVEYTVTPQNALIESFDPIGALILGVVLIGLVALVEEALFRGILQRSLEHRYGPKAGIPLASVLFATMYAVVLSPTILGLALGLGLVYGVVYYRTESLVVVTAMHGTANVFLYGVIPLFGPLVALPSVV